MNQVTNKIPYGLLTEEEQAQFCRYAKVRGMYEMYDNKAVWKVSGYEPKFCKWPPYRLIIKDDEWYYFESGCVTRVWEGVEITSRGIDNMQVLRPATPAEIEAAKPKELTLEDKIKAKYPDYEVDMLYWGLTDILSCKGHTHASAQSMKGFYRYVYQHIDGDWDTSTSPTMMWDKGITLQPVAVLFERDK